MVELDIPGRGRLELRRVVLDFNGTLALDGRLLDGVAPLLRRLSAVLDVDVVTADTFGFVRRELKDLPCAVTVIPAGDEDETKAGHIRSAGADETVAIGNGRNDRRMLQAAALGIVVIQREGAACGTLAAADLVFGDITAALDALLHPQRLMASLRT